MAPGLVKIYDIIYEFGNKELQHTWLVSTAPDVATLQATFASVGLSHPSGLPKIISIKNVGTAYSL